MREFQKIGSTMGCDYRVFVFEESNATYLQVTQPVLVLGLLALDVFVL